MWKISHWAQRALEETHRLGVWTRGRGNRFHEQNANDWNGRRWSRKGIVETCYGKRKKGEGQKFVYQNWKFRKYQWKFNQWECN